MFIRLTRSPGFLGLALVLCVCAFGLYSASAQDDSWDDDFKKPETPGGRTFNSNCAGCHGLDGRGSDKGANIAGSARVRHLTDAQVSAIISNGISGTGMPSFHSLGARQVGLLVGHIRTLQGKLDARTPPGNSDRGKRVFFGKGGCSSCHMISGEGGFLGPDLSAYGAVASARRIRDEIVKQQRSEPPGYKSALITTATGDRLEGIVRNEDNFSVQLQTQDGAFHFLSKSDLKSVDAPGKSLMPTNYGEVLSPDELNDLVSFVMNPSPATRGETPSSKEPAH
jgi:cytochrome c oxidase cbb3-type subunit 3